MGDFGWDFLRDEHNREALKVLGGALAALAFAGWAVFREFRTIRRLQDISAEVDQLKASQADILRSLERTEQRHDLLFGVMVGKTELKAESAKPDESPEESEQ